MVKNIAAAIIGIGNTIAGDDGAGIVALETIQTRFPNRKDLFFHTISGDLFEISDYLDITDRFIFLDAVAGEIPGNICRVDKALRAFTPSFHQTDVGTAMQSLAALRIVAPFPQWEIWGITINQPKILKEGLSEVVSESVEKLCVELEKFIQSDFTYTPYFV